MNQIKISKRLVYLLLLFNLSLGSFIRYSDYIGIENGSPDSWEYHLQANQIISDGNIGWALNFLSYYGFYPPYLEVGLETVLAALSLVSGVHLTYSIIYFSVFCGLISGFFMFITSRGFFGGKFIPIVSAILFSCSPAVYQATIWGIYQRLIFSIFALIIFFLMLRFAKEKDSRHFSLLLFSALTISSLHKSCIFILPVIIIFISLYSFHNKNYEVFSKYNLLDAKRWHRTISIVIALIVVMVLFGTFINNRSESLLLVIYQYGIDISFELGLSIIFLFLGLPALYNSKWKFPNTFFIAILILAVFLHLVIETPRSNIREPVFFYLFFPIYFILISLGVNYFLKMRFIRQTSVVHFVVFSLIISIIPSYLQFHEIENSSTPILGNSNTNRDYYHSVKATGLYLKNSEPDSSNLYHIGRMQIHAVKSFSDGKYFTDTSFIIQEYLDYKWNLTEFIGSKKAEGFVSIEPYTLTEMNTLSYYDNSLNSPRVQLDFQSRDIDGIVISETFNVSDYRLTKEIDENYYKEYRDSIITLYSLDK